MGHKEFFEECGEWFIAMADNDYRPRAVSVDFLYKNFKARMEAERDERVVLTGTEEQINIWKQVYGNAVDYVVNEPIGPNDEQT